MFDAMNFVTKEIASSVEVKVRMLDDRELVKNLARITEEVIATYRAGGKTLMAGNGGSAADAQHLAAEFVSRFYFDRPGLASIALSSDPSVVTAIGNDYGFENLFSRQIEAHGKKGDMLFAISTSGRSSNILKAVATAKRIGIKTVALTGERGGDLARACDFALVVPSAVTPKIQECHITLGHAICAGVEEALFKK